jgi:hypothetical protein
MDGINLMIIRDGKGYDITHLVESLQWSGRKGAPSRSVSAALLDDEGCKHDRAEIDITEGHHCIFSYGGQERFRGMIMSTKQTQAKKMSFTAYDLGSSLANNDDTFCYESKTATEIFIDCCTRFGIPYSEAARTTHRIPDLTKPKTTAWDAIADALSLEYRATGIRHFVTAEKGSLKLLTRRENILRWVIETGVNLISYTRSRSIAKIKTRIKLISDEGTVVAEKSNEAQEEKIGIFQGIEQPDETLTDAQIKDLVSTMLDEKSMPEDGLDIEAVGIAEVISGMGVFVIIPHLDLSQTFYVDEDIHTFTDQYHSMKLKLNPAGDLEKETPSEKAAEAAYSIGDAVQFSGGNHYVSSNAGSPTGGTRKGGPAKLTLIAKGAKHPYHLIHTDGISNVYGWVDEGTFAK